MLAIRVKYVGASNFKPSRLIASINGAEGKTRSVAVSYAAAEDEAGSGASSAQIFAVAAKALMRKIGLKGSLVSGELPDGSQAFVFDAGEHYEQNPAARKELLNAAKDVIFDLNMLAKRSGPGPDKRRDNLLFAIENAEKFNNPRPRIGSSKPGRVSSATGLRPTKRLVSRRKSNTRKGYFPNPAPVVYNGYQIVYADGVYKVFFNEKHIVNAGSEYSAKREIDKLPLGFKKRGLKKRTKNPVRPLAKRAGIRFYRKHAGKWLMFDPGTWPAKTRAEAQKIAQQLAAMYKTQIRVVIDK